MPIPLRALERPPLTVNPYRVGQTAYRDSSFVVPETFYSGAEAASPHKRGTWGGFAASIPEQLLDQSTRLAGNLFQGVGGPIRRAQDLVGLGPEGPLGDFAYANPLYSSSWLLEELGKEGAKGQPLGRGWFGQNTAPLATRETFESAEGLTDSTIEAIKFAVEEFPEAMVYAGAIMASAPLTAVSEVTRIAKDRASNDGRDPNAYTFGDVAISAPSAIANVYLERFAIRYGLGKTPDFLRRFATSNPAKRILAAGGMQSGFEAIQEGIEYPTTVLGTQTPYDASEHLARAKMGAIAGFLPGTAFGAAGTVADQFRPVSREETWQLAGDIQEDVAPGGELESRQIYGLGTAARELAPETVPEEGGMPTLDYYTGRLGQQETAGTSGRVPHAPTTFVDTIYDNLLAQRGGRAPSKRDVISALRDTIVEENISHEALLRALTAKEGEDRPTGGQFPSRDEFLIGLFKNRIDDINEWFSTPDGQPYGLLYEESLEGAQNDAEIERAQRAAAAEYIHQIARKEGLASGTFKFVLRRIKNAFLSSTGKKFSNKEIYDLLLLARKQGREALAGVSIEDAGAETIPQLAAIPFDPSRRKFLKQTGGAIAGAALDPSMLLEPATADAPVEGTWTGWPGEQYPGSIYEFDIVVDPTIGRFSGDDPGERTMSVAFTHNPNTNEVTVYEDHEVVDEFTVDDMHADAEVIEYARTKYGRENIDSARVQREEMERDIETGEGSFDYWGDADERFDNMAASMIRGEQTMAGVERVERGPAYDYFDEPETPTAPEPKEAPKQVPYKWRELETSELEALMKERRVAGNPIWRAMQNELNNRKQALPAPEAEPVQEVEAEVAETVDVLDDILVIYDDVEEMREAAKDGSLNERILMFTDRTGIPREELWDSVNKKMDSLEDAPSEEDLRLSALPRSQMSDAEVLNRDVRNEATKKFRRAIRESDLPQEDKAERTALLKDLLRLWGKEGISRNLEPGDRATFRQYAQMIVDGELDAVREFVNPFLDQIKEQKAPSKTKKAKRAYYAGYKGVTVDELMKYRERGTTHPLERKMTYPFADEEINRLEEGGEITAEEAELRRTTARDLRAALEGKLPQGVKRKLTEIVYGIEDYTDITPWTEVYTKEELGKMEERAEVAQAEARRTRYEKTKLTKAQETQLLKEPPTPAELEAIAKMEGDEAFINLKTKRDKLLFLRKPSPMSDAERSELEAFMSDVKGWDQSKFRKEKAEKLSDELEAAGIEVQRIPAKEGEWTPQKDRMLWKQGRNIKQIGQNEWDTLESSDEYTHAGETYTSQGEKITEEEGFEFLDEKLSALPKGKKLSVGDSVRFEHYNPNTRKKVSSIGTIESISPENPEMALIKFNKENRNDILVNVSHKDLYVHEEDANRKLRKDVFDKSFSIIKKLFVKDAEHSALRALGSMNPYGDRRRGNASILKALEKSKAGGSSKWDIDHIIAVTLGGMNFSMNLMPLPNWANTVLNNKSLSAILESDTNNANRLKRAFKYMENDKNWENSSELQVIARAFDFANTDASMESFVKTQQEYSALAGINLPDGGVMLSHELFKGKKGLQLRLALYGNEKYAFKDQEVQHGMDWDVEAAQLNKLAKGLESNEDAMINSALGIAKTDKKGYTEHFSDKFWYRATSYLWGKPVQAIRDFNKLTRFGLKRGSIRAADQIADLIQRAHSAQTRASGMEKGTDLIQDVSIRTGGFFSVLSRAFAKLTDGEGVINKSQNQQVIDHLSGKDVKFTSSKIEKGAKEVAALIKIIYEYAKTETKGLEDVLDLRGHGDTLVPRVWNIEFMASRAGKAKFLRVISEMFSPPGKTKPIFEDADITAEDLYDVVINSGGFVQGDWSTVKADQVRSDKDIAKDLKVQEYLDMLTTENLLDEGLILDDLQALMPRFVQKAVERTEYSKRFGKNDEILRDLIKRGVEQIREHNLASQSMKKGTEKLPHINERLFEKSVWDMARILRNRYGYDMANMPTRKWLQRGQNAQVILKLPLVTLASMPEFFTPMLRGDVRPDKWAVDFLGATAWAGYKGMNGLSKLIFNKHLPAMRKKASEIGGMGIIRDIALLRELGIADIQAMGDLVSTRYANPNFARGGLRGGAKGTFAGRVPKHVRATFNMQTFIQATLLTTMTEMQQYIALRNYQRHMSKRLKFISENKDKPTTARRKRLLQQFRNDLLDYGITEDINLDTSDGLAEFNAGALRFIDQVITRPNDATTAKIFKNPLTAPLVLFKRFITTYGNTLLTSVGNDIAHKVDNVERAKQVGKVVTTAMAMYGAVMFAEIMRGAIMGDLDEDDFELMPKDFQQFMRRLERTGLLSGPGTLLVNLGFPYKRGWWDTTESRVTGELLGPLGGDATAIGDALLDPKDDSLLRVLRQVIPLSKTVLPKPGKRDKRSKGYSPSTSATQSIRY